MARLLPPISGAAMVKFGKFKPWIYGKNIDEAYINMVKDLSIYPEVIAKQHNLLVSVDNTFATPYLQQPFKYGVDFVFHSTTKFLNGHGTAIGGVLIGKDIELMQTKVWKWHALLGGNGNPFDAFLLITGMKTLELRMDRHCSNAMIVAQYLENHPAVAHVNYTGLASHPDFAVSAKQMKHPGALMSFELKGGLETGKQFINKLQIFVVSRNS